MQRLTNKQKRLKPFKYIEYNDLINRNLHKKELIKHGFKFINRTNKYKKILAYIFIGFGAVTLPLPTGSIFLIILGFSMLGIKRDSLKRYYKLLIYRRRTKRNNTIKKD